MNRNGLNVLKANLLGGMDDYVRSINDEGAYDWWSAEGVPDGADEDELMEIAKDSKEFAEICTVFGKIVGRYVKSAQDECAW